MQKWLLLLSGITLYYLYLSPISSNKVSLEMPSKMLPSASLPKKEQETTIETFSGNLSFYGPDCVGCSGITASGMRVTSGNIYYQDQEYGQVKIVAGDRAYPFGTIVKIKMKEEEFFAIVLDRGSAIGKGKRFLFDLLMTSEQEASVYGYLPNITFEIYRLGF